MLKILYVIICFILPIIVFIYNKKYDLAGVFLGVLSLIVFIEKNQKAKEFVKKIF